jgi:PRTRC genetic system protein B
MKIESICHSGREMDISLKNAILMYTGNEGLVYASLHSVEHSSEYAEIKAGVPLSKSALLETLKALAPEEYMPVDLLDPRILAMGNGYLVWYSKPQKRQVWFKCEELGNVSAETDHPGLVFMVSGNEWYVFAIKQNARPKASTPLCQAPYFNVWESGNICTGNVKLPEGNERFNPDAWENAFFRSYFTHPNVFSKDALTKFRGGIFALWKKLLAGGKFDNATLVPIKETLATAFERVVRHGLS